MNKLTFSLLKGQNVVLRYRNFLILPYCDSIVLPNPTLRSYGLNCLIAVFNSIKNDSFNQLKA